MRNLRLTLALLAVAWLGVMTTALAAAPDGVLAESPEVVIVKSGQSETVALPGTAYRDFVVTEEQASFTLDGFALPEGTQRVRGGMIAAVSWTPLDDASTAVTVQFLAKPMSSLINAVEGTSGRPLTPQVLAGFTFPLEAKPEDEESFPVVGSYGKPVAQRGEDEHGAYDLPKLPPAKYSDALVTLQVNGVDFRDVLWFLSRVGNVSIMLDPYWADEPTGNRRPPGAGADPGAGNNGGDGEPGFRGAPGFVPGMMREGTGSLSLNFENVPFDRALELVVMAAGLVMVEIQPNS